jgi:transcriptional regulator with XRE-family HTH domain
MRKALSLRGSELGALLDVTAETISRWENGQRNVHRTAWVALGSMVLEKMQGSTSTLDRLQMLTHDELAPNVVRLAV